MKRKIVFILLATLLVIISWPCESAFAGYIEAWGDNFYGQIDLVPTGNDFEAIAAGVYHSLALKSDRSVVGWGYNEFGQADVPAEAASDVVAIAAGKYHSLVLKSDRSLYAWGRNNNDQTNVPLGYNFTAISTWHSHSLALKSDESLVAWGYNGFGQTDVPAGNGFVAIAAGSMHSLALWDEDHDGQGYIVAWGDDNFGQCSDIPGGATEDSGRWISNDTDFVAIAGGGEHSLARKSDGSLVGWGRNDSSQIDVPPGYDFVAIAAGANHSLALKSDGSIVGWGYNIEGQADPPMRNDYAAVAGNGNYGLALVPEPATLLLLGLGGLLLRKHKRL